MPYEPLILDDAPELSGEAAAQLLDLLYALTTALENHYFDRIHQTLEPSPTQYDRFHSAPESVDFDDPLPDF